MKKKSNKSNVSVFFRQAQKSIQHFYRTLIHKLESNKESPFRGILLTGLRKTHNFLLYPSVKFPKEDYFDRYYSAKSPEYKEWIKHFEKHTPEQWRINFKEAWLWKEKPFFSVITPCYNTPSAVLYECVESVRFQSYQHWELILINDRSDAPDTLECFERIKGLKDRRIKILNNPKNQGTCLSTNFGVNQASGDYIAILDHDDRLTLNALYEAASFILKREKPDMIYSDRDLISPSGERHDRISKPSWAPETLLSGNYIFHLVVVKKSLFLELGGYRKAYEGSQDLDFLLRLAEKTDHVVHIPKVLYNFRQVETSCAYDLDSKSYIFESGVLAVQEALKRRNLNADAYEIKNIWRGNYAVKFRSYPDFELIEYDCPENLADYLNERIASSSKSYFMIRRRDVHPNDEKADRRLISFFQIHGIACITGKIFRNGVIVHAGLVARKNGVPLNIFWGGQPDMPGPLGSAMIMRNVALVHPCCFAVSKKVWKRLGGLDSSYKGVYTVFDFAMRCNERDYRHLFVPFSHYHAEEETEVPAVTEDHLLYNRRWEDHAYSIADPYYNINLSRNHSGMRLKKTRTGIAAEKNKW